MTFVQVRKFFCQLPLDFRVKTSCTADTDDVLKAKDLFVFCSAKNLHGIMVFVLLFYVISVWFTK